jgi:integral membrane sensor domain MASE1
MRGKRRAALLPDPLPSPARAAPIGQLCVALAISIGAVSMSVKTSLRSRGGRRVAAARGPIVFAFAYYLGAEAAFFIGTLSDKIFAPFWPPNVFLFLALLLVPYRRWPLYILAGFPAHVLAEIGVGMGWTQIVVAFATNCMVATLIAFGIRVLLPQKPRLSGFNSAMAYILIAAVGSPAICALGGAFVRVAGGGSMADYPLYWQQWFFANALASITLGAAILTWMDKQDWAEFRSPTRLIEALLLGAGLVLACVVAFRSDAWGGRNFLPALLYMPLPFILWAAVRFGSSGANAAVLVVTVAAIALTLNGPTVFMRAEAEDNVLALQVFLTGLAVPVLLLAASVDGMRRAERSAAALASLVLGAQDDERRHVAKSLHEHIAQKIVAATWLAWRIQPKLPAEDQPTAQELEQALHGSLQDLRSLSYLLHPPLLDEGGVSPALQALVQDYHRHHKFVVQLDISPRVGRLPQRVELTTFRLVEEALANFIGGGCAPARVSVDRQESTNGQSVILTIERLGRDNRPFSSLGTRLQATDSWSAHALSLARMRERLRSIGGSADFVLSAHSLSVKAIIPVAD